MKKLFFVLIVLTAAFGMSLSAQSNTEEIDLIQSIFGMEKKAMVDGFINPAPATATAFWEIYDAYEVERKELGKKRIGLINKYIDNYGVMDNDQTSDLMGEIIAQQKASDKLVEQYYKKMNKSVSANEAAAFYQVEMYVLSRIRLELMNSLPFFGEFD